MTRLGVAAMIGNAVFAAAAAQADPFAEALAHADAGRHGLAAAGFHALAVTGDAEAQFNLALLFATGQGLPQNAEEAALWAWRARLAGLEQAGPLAARLMDALPQERRGRLAARLEATLVPDAERGDGAAMLALAAVIALVRPEPDLVAAYGWQSIAAATDTPGAVVARNETFARIEPNARPEAQDHALAAFVAWCGTRAGHAGAAEAPACAAVAASDAGQSVAGR